ncbi:MAG: hypothetical protein RIC82_09485, partial [Parvibaculum sp.]
MPQCPIRDETAQQYRHRTHICIADIDAGPPHQGIEITPHAIDKVEQGIPLEVLSHGGWHHIEREEDA